MIFQRKNSLLIAVLMLVQIVLPCNALSSGLLIVYPKVKAPYSKIYRDIIKGIDKNYTGITKQLEILPDNSTHTLTEKIEQDRPDVLVTLGRHSLKKVRQLKLPIPIVAGAITKTEGIIPGVSMTPDSEIILSHLFTIAPFVRRVYVVTDGSRQAQLARAEAYLADRNKILQAEEVLSVQQAADKYLKIVSKASFSDAIWLMRGASLNDPSILMLILEAAWKKRIVVFSSNPSHVKRGALFSVYPDNEKMGGALAEMAQQEFPSEHNTGLVPLIFLHLIVNKRTSKHFGINPNNISGLNVHKLL